MKETWFGVIKTSSARIFSLLVNVALLALTAHILGPEGRGIIAGITTWVGLAATLGGLSLGQVVLHRAAGQRDDTWIQPIFTALLFSAAILTVFTWCVLLWTWLYKANLFGSLPVWGLVMGFLTLPFAIWEGYGGYLLIASGDLSFVNRRLVLTTAAGFLLMATLLLMGGGVVAALATTLLTLIAVSLTGFWRLWNRAGKRCTLVWSQMRGLIVDGLKLHLNAVGGVLILGTDVLMVNYYLSPSDVGHYQLAVQLLSTMLIIPASAGMVLNQAMGKHGPDGMWPMQKRLLAQMLLLMLACGAVAYVLSPWLIVLVAGEAFKPTIETFRLVLWSLVGMSLSQGMANQWLGRGLFLQTAIATLVSGLANLGLNIYLVPKYGVNGAAWSTVIVYNVAMWLNVGMAVYVESRHRAWRRQAAVSQ